MDYSIRSICRGDGKGYIAIEAPGLNAEHLRAEALAPNGSTIVCGVYSFAYPNEDNIAAHHSGDEHALTNTDIASCVLTVPLLDDTDLQVRLYDTTLSTANPVFSFPFKPLASKIRSRLTYTFDSETARHIRGIDQRHLAVSPYLYVTGIFPISASEVSCRFIVRFPNDDRNKPINIQVFDAQANRLETTPMVIEDTEIYTRGDMNTPVWQRLYAIRIPNDQTTLCISVSQDEHGGPYGNFTCILPTMFQGFLNGVRDGTRSAYTDPTYGTWFEKRRADRNDLIAERKVISNWKYHPTISVVSVLFNTPEEYLRAFIRSILGQSYKYFELVLVNVSNDTHVDDILSEYHDDRIRVLHAKNQDIASNTNIGITAAQGDYIAFVDHDDVIEPDALYHYAAALQENNDIDVMYCDEDYLDNGIYNRPFFKPDFNRDLLYSYNYISHMLMVSRHVLKQVELSPADVAGAQDFDLTLKCTERARSIKHIPYVLYHWRAHEGSTSANPDSKPYADEAGRLALSRHFERRGIPAHVHTTEIPFRYRTTYHLNASPKINIVIPTKDHISALSTCVDSILSKTQYDNYDITLVENNSVERETFEYYNAIQHQSSRVNVVTWPGKGFNYSAICNYGAYHSQGDIILFLNNDTEVITPNWLTDMVNFFARPEVGLASAKLICHDGIVQHGGIWVSVNKCGYLGYDLAADDRGYMDLMRYPSDVEAVIGACQMIRRSLFEELGGLDEDLAVVLSDVDLCLKAEQAGYLTVFEPRAMLYHNEHTSRGRDEDDPVKKIRADNEYSKLFLKWNAMLRPGRFINANLNQYDGNFKINY